MTALDQRHEAPGDPGAERHILLTPPALHAHSAEGGTDPSVLHAGMVLHVTYQRLCRYTAPRFGASQRSASAIDQPLRRA